jgi:serine/threonine protein kinase
MEQGATAVFIYMLTSYFFDVDSELFFFFTRWALLDFEFAEHARDGEKGVNDIMGTDRFMAPEAHRGQRSTKSDIFSLAACVDDLGSDLQSKRFLLILRRIGKREKNN